MAPAESHRAALSFPSGNAKTGPIAVSSTSRRTCPSSYSLAGDQDCYAEAGFRTRLHWDRLSAGRLGATAAAWSYTHFPMGPANQASLRQAAAKGLVVNASTESRSIAAGLQRQGIPAVCVVPPDAPAVFRHEGVRFVACPATRPGSRVQCSSCGGRWGLPLCAQAARSFVVTFPAHGARAAAAASHCS